MAKPHDRLTLTVDWPEITVNRLSRVTTLWSHLVEAITREATGKSESVKWVVTKVTYASPFNLEVTPEAASRKLNPDVPGAISHAIVNGIADLSESSDVPDYFSPQALSITRKLAAYSDSVKQRSIIVSNGVDRPAPLTHKVVAAIDDIVGSVAESYGTIEGRLEGVLTHGKQRFFIWDSLGGKQIRCVFDEDRVPLDDILSAFNKRVSVSGRIRSRSLTGERLTIDVAEFMSFRPDSELMPPDEIIRVWREH